jgi:hypothetical protein
MARKHRLKRSANNPFTKLTGKPVIKLSGVSSCQVVDGKTINLKEIGKQAPTKLVAAFLYLTHPSILSEFSSPHLLPPDSLNEHTISLSDIKKVVQTCGVDQCVNPAHLQVTLREQQGWGTW